jgi:serine protease Do
MRRFTIVTVALSSAVAFLVGVIVAGGVGPTPVVSSAPPAAVSPGVRPVATPLPAGVVNFADVAEKVNPAVVNIDAASHAVTRRGDHDEGSGSGFIIDRQGFILTNYHVIEGADRITVTLADGRALRADVIGTDPAIDVALVRVPGVSDLPEAKVGNSDDLRVGEWVCAIGNPLGYVHSVTVGVVSFIGRKLFDASLDDYIQTDAAINFGNSGGPLINARGEVIGINSAISSRASNIGFAVPINQAMGVVPQLKTRGKVSRGFIGVELTDVTPDLQRSLKLPVNRGALVQDITPDSPAERAGLRPYDIIVSVDGRAVWTNDELIRDISGRQPGTIARLDVVRDGRHLPTAVKLTERPAREDDDDDDHPDGMPSRSGAAPAVSSADPPLGLTVRELDTALARRLDIPAGIGGVVVMRVDPADASFVPGIHRGFVVMEINREPVRSVAEYQRIVNGARGGDVLAFFGYDTSLGQRMFVTATMDERR